MPAVPWGFAKRGAERGMVSDQFDVSLEDDELMREVELTANLIVAASQSDDRLSTEEIDRILGVTNPPSA